VPRHVLRIVLFAVVLALSSAPAALAAEPIVVDAGGAKALITRAPFRLAVTDGAGRTLLSEVPNTGQAPLPVAPAPDPVPLGQDTQRRPALYAPLAFTVGDSRHVQYPAAQWEGDELAGTEAGVTYSARDVLTVTPEGGGVRLVVGTSDPSGRRLIVSVRPDHRAIRVSVQPDPPDGVATMGDAFAAGAAEAFRGFGGRHDALDQRGHDFYNWVEQENVGAGELGPAVSPGYQFPSGSGAAYYVQSQFVSSAGYGFLLDRPELSRWRMASDAPDAWLVGVAARGLDYLVMPGGPSELTAITGRQRVPPSWAAGTILDREVKYQEDAASYKADVEADLRDIKKYGLPLDGYRIEGWQFVDRAWLRSVIARLKAMGIHPMLYFRAFVGSDNTGTDDPAMYDEAVAKGYVATDATGRPYTFVSNFSAPGAQIDFTKPDAVKWWQGRVREALALGADGFMQDFGEQVQVDMHFHDGSTGAEMHNRLPALYHRATRDVAGDDVFFFTRTGYSGTPGAPAYENANFPGDETTDWSRATGLASQTPDMLNRAIGGAYGFTTDIGGYFDIGPYQPTSKELFLRWAEWAALSPFFRLHGSVGAGTHTPWSFDAETVALYNALSRLHLAARPLVLKLWREAVETGVPPTRPLWLAYPGDAEAAKQDQEWLLGDDVLVAPVVDEGATARSVYFPRGCWRAVESGARYDGPRSASVAAPLDALPYFFRCGTEPFAAASRGSAGRLPRTCTSRRRFVIHLRRGLSAVRVYVNGRRTRLLKRRRARVDLRGLPRGRFFVRVVGRTRAGRRYVAQRTYRTCVPRPRRAGS
jgi:alpha-glucosidase